MAHIHITEHKSSGTPAPEWVGRRVRVFIDRDYHYGYFVEEYWLYNALTPEQQAHYLATEHDAEFEVPQEVAQELVERGHSPYK